jgi:dGTPase
VAVSPELAEQKRQLEAFLQQRVYRHPDVVRHRQDAQARLRWMFERLLERPELLPDRYRQRSEAVGLARCVADYLAGMTDRFAQLEYERLCAG